jgi:hypothetical protein
MQYIHLKCLQEWINGKKSVRELPYSCIYLFRLSQCELCKSPFQDSDKKVQKYEIFKLSRPAAGHYIVMEVLGMSQGKTFQVIKLGEKTKLKIVRFE